MSKNALKGTEKAENDILDIEPTILSVLLIDRTTNKNIIWATDHYKQKGVQYSQKKAIKLELITGKNANIIRPRILKSQNEKTTRAREKAEVFTPSWMCNIQNNLIDERWFEQKNVFNVEKKESWKANKNKIVFPKGKSWKDYVKNIRLEITCGEAPYIVSRYDTVTGKSIPIKERIGLLDRKLRVIGENTKTKKEWLKWAKIAYKSTYGYDWQGDNVLLARKNLIFTVLEYYKEKFQEEIKNLQIMQFAEIISWNIWQMDGARGVIPDSCRNNVKTKKVIKCIGCQTNNINKHNGTYCKIMDWEEKKAIKFVSLMNKGKE